MSLKNIDRAVKRLLAKPETERGALAARLRRLAAEVDEPIRAERRAKARADHLAQFRKHMLTPTNTPFLESLRIKQKPAEMHEGENDAQ